MSKETKKHRVLVDVTIEGKKYLANQVVIMSAALAASHVKNGQLDDNAAAVKYAESEGAEAVVHISAAEAEAAAEQLAAKEKASKIDALKADLVALEKQLAAAPAADKATIEGAIAKAKDELKSLEA